MRAYLQQQLYRIKGSYWFIPSLMILGAILLSQITVLFDRSHSDSWGDDLWISSLNQPEGARALLATVAGSMITVAGVTFSLTILAVSHATSHFGPRLLENFMRDRGNQVTLGTFIATFVYCLLALRVVRGAGSLGESTVEASVFVPQLSLFIAFLLTLASVAELVYFIHHVPDSIHISTVLQRLSIDMDAKLDELYPETVGEAHDSEAAPLPEFSFTKTITSSCSGYLQGIDDKELMEFAIDRDIVTRLLRRPGDFVRVHEPIAELTEPDRWTDDCPDVVRHAFTIGFTRTPTQDAFFVLNQFVEVATRALSPGVKDPFTAMQCIDWISVAFVKLARRKMPSSRRTDDQNNIRIITSDVNYSHFVDSMVKQLMPYASRDTNVRQYLKESLQQVIAISENKSLNELLEKQLEETES